MALFSVFTRSYFGLGFTFLTITAEVIGLPQPVVAIICWVKEVDVADEHLQERRARKYTTHERSTGKESKVLYLS